MFMTRSADEAAFIKAREKYYTTISLSLYAKLNKGHLKILVKSNRPHIYKRII